MSYPAVFPVTANWWSSTDPADTATTSTPEWLPINGLVTFTPRLPKGFTAYTANFPTAVNQDAIQTITLTGTPTGGTWTISYGGYTTTALAPNASASVVQAALVALTSIGTGNCTVASPVAFNYTVTFTGTLGNKPIAPLTTDGHLLTPTTTITVENNHARIHRIQRTHRRRHPHPPRPHLGRRPVQHRRHRLPRGGFGGQRSAFEPDRPKHSIPDL